MTEGGPLRLRSPYTVRLLSDDDVERIHGATLDILENIGLRIDSESTLRELERAGANVDLQAERVRLPRALVEEALALAPKELLFAARDPSWDLPIDGNGGYLSLDGTPAFVLDLQSGERRPPTTEDYIASMRLADAMPELAYTWPPFAISDIPPRLQPAMQAYLELAECTKHAQPNEVITPQDARATIEMCVAILGSEEELRRRPIVSSYQCAISPLSYDGAAIEAALEFARAGVPAGFVSMAVSTAAVPTTLAGHLVAVNAELIGGIAILQTLVPAAPTFYGPYQAFMDLRSGDMDPAWGGEDVLFKLAAAQMAERYELPINIMGFGTGAKTADWQAGVQHAMSLMGVSMAARADVIAAIGTLHGSRVFSFEQALLDAELFGMVCHMLDRGFPVSDETIGYEAIEAAGPGGHFLGHPHTLAHMREKWMSTFFGTESWEEWEGSGRPEPKDRAREKAKQIVAEHVPQRLPDDVDAACRAIVERRRRELEDA